MTLRSAARVAAVISAVALIAFVGRLALTPVRNLGAPERAPRFVAMTLDRTPVARTLDDYAGHPILLNIWATWCDPCREEMPSLQRLHESYKDRGLKGRGHQR